MCSLSKESTYSEISFPKIFSVNIQPGSLDSAFNMHSLTDGENRMTIDDVISDSNIDISMVFEERPKLENIVIFKNDFDKLIRGEDYKMQELIKLICMKDYSIKAAAEKIGISHTGASNRLKRLQKKKIVKEITKLLRPILKKGILLSNDIDIKLEVLIGKLFSLNKKDFKVIFSAIEESDPVRSGVVAFRTPRLVECLSLMSRMAHSR